MALLPDSRAVLAYWFGEGDSNSVSYIQDRMGLWFMGKSSEFNQVQFDNAELVNRLSLSREEDLLSWSDPSGMLARVILFDQFPRCIYRGSARAFAFDKFAVSLVLEAVEKGIFQSDNYCAIQRFFMCVALQHSECLEHQDLGVHLARTALTHDSSEDVKNYFSCIPGYPLEHRDVIARFGRFPSRNLALGRESTPEEVLWMQSAECPSWARSQLPPPSSNDTEDN